MRRVTKHCFLAGFLFLLSLSTANALSISPWYTDADPNDGKTWTAPLKALVDDAIKEWTDRLCKPITIFIDFQFGGTASLGVTKDFEEDSALHLPLSATIYMNSGNDLSWNLAGPVDGKYDALTVLKHEIGHAIGFTSNYSKFKDKVRYTDSNGNGTYDNGEDKWFEADGVNGKGVGDYDLYDSRQTHLATAGDLMYPFLDKNKRFHPSETDLKILHEAFEYPIHPVPEPSTLLLLATGLAGALAVRRKI
jgi:hypothetical protein